MARLAAEELRDYVKKISDTTLAIVTTPSTNPTAQIYVGRSVYTQSQAGHNAPALLHHGPAQRLGIFFALGRGVAAPHHRQKRGLL